MKKWIAEASTGNRAMVLEEDGSEDGRLVADKVAKDDAALIAMLPDLLAALDSLSNMAATFPTELSASHQEVVTARDLVTKANSLTRI